MGLSQERFADMMRVSRQTVTKWEGDESLPDASHLKELSRYFGIPVDTLLDHTNELPRLAMTEHYDGSDYAKLKGFTIKDSVMVARFGDSFVITPLARSKKLTLLQQLIDIFAFGAGTIELGVMVGELKERYFLLEKNHTTLLVRVTDDTITTKEVDDFGAKKSFIFESYRYQKGKPISRG